MTIIRTPGVEFAQPLVGRPVIFGELFFQLYEDGKVQLSGAPFHIAWHLHGFGLTPILISRVGKDPSGERALTAMNDWGMDTSAIQIDPTRPTGAACIRVEQGTRSRSIMANQAYDFIDASIVYRLLNQEQISLLYHGTLITRHAVSRAALRDFRVWSEALTFVDLNLQAPWWDHELITSALQRACWALLDLSELRIIAGKQQLEQKQLVNIMQDVRKQFGLELLIVRGGKDGSWFVTAHQNKHYPAVVTVATSTNSDGVSDAFTAVALLGLSLGWPLTLIQQRASEFAGLISQHRNAIFNNRHLYVKVLQRWGLSVNLRTQ